MINKEKKVHFASHAMEEIKKTRGNCNEKL
jgi:hypothetical protein